MNMIPEWSNFFFAIICATGSLLGLLFVAISINISKIASSEALSKAAIQPLFLLLVMLVESIYFLIPRQSLAMLGIEIIGTGLIIGMVMMINDIWVFKTAPKKYRKKYFTNIAFNQLPVLFVVVSGALLIAKMQAGVFFMVPAIILSFAQAITISWALLVSIHQRDGDGRWNKINVNNGENENA